MHRTNPVQKQIPCVCMEFFTKSHRLYVNLTCRL